MLIMDMEDDTFMNGTGSFIHIFYSNGSSHHSNKPPSQLEYIGYTFYAWFTPLIFIIGIFGNSLSLVVFTSRNMRSLSASNYLAALSLSDLLALLFYVLIEWLHRGLPHLPGDHKAVRVIIPGLCQITLYLNYLFRFLSSWLVVIFTVERYIGVCHPMRLRDMCSASCSRRAIGLLTLIASVLLLFKPALSGVVLVREDKPPLMCVSKMQYLPVALVLDSIYAVSIIHVPFLVITILNIMIIRKLVLRNRRHRESRVITEENMIRLEFTIILLAISLCFIAFNLPFFVVWLRTILATQRDSAIISTSSWQPGVLPIVRAIFYMNYCINFFLYSITGAYFRKEVIALFKYRMKRDHYTGRSTKSSPHTHQSWV